MSKHNHHNKPYHNYNNYSGNNAAVKTEEPVVEVTEELEAITEETVEEVVEPEVTEETVEEAVEPEAAPAMGVVTCKLLRVRSTPDTTADNIVCEITEGTEVQIDETESTADFYKIVTTAGAEGFCMKKFITIK